jgi:hypothetical protein
MMGNEETRREKDDRRMKTARPGMLIGLKMRSGRKSGERSRFRCPG